MEVGERLNVRVGARLGLTAQCGRQEEAAHTQIVRLVVAAVEMNDELAADRNVDQGIARAVAGGAAVAQQALDMDRLVGHAARNARVDHVDDAAHRRRAEQKGARAAQHLDPVRGQRVDRDRMVDAGVGDVEAADAVGHDPDALALEAAQDRPGGVGPVGGGRDAGLPRQRVADRRTDVARQLLAAEHRSAGQHVGAIAAEAGDDDVPGFLRVVSCRRRRLLRSGRRGLGRLRRGIRGLSRRVRRLGERGLGKQGRCGPGKKAKAKHIWISVHVGCPLAAGRARAARWN